MSNSDQSRPKTSEISSGSSQMQRLKSQQVNRLNNGAAQQCPLYRLPPVGEVEHSIYKCFCHLCTCGLHQCPGDYSNHSKNLSSAFWSEYMKEYRRKHADIGGFGSLKDLRQGYCKNNLPMDLLTTKAIDFQKYDIEENKGSGLKSNSKTTYGQNFCGRSMYYTNYPNWGPVEVIRARPMHLPYRGDQVKLDSNTSYRDFIGGIEKFWKPSNPTPFSRYNSHRLLANPYQGNDLDLSNNQGPQKSISNQNSFEQGMPDRTKSANSSSSNIYKPGKKPINKNLIGSAVLSPSNVFFGNTTTAREFKAPMRRHFAIRAKNKNFGGDSLKNSPFAYTTTYRHDFIRFKTDKLPERKREALKLRQQISFCCNMEASDQFVQIRVRQGESNILGFRLKRDTVFKKVFDTFCQRFGFTPGTLRFVFEGERVNDDSTPNRLQMQDGDVIDSFVEQTGGNFKEI